MRCRERKQGPASASSRSSLPGAGADGLRSDDPRQAEALLAGERYGEAEAEARPGGRGSAEFGLPA